MPKTAPKPYQKIKCWEIYAACNTASVFVLLLFLDGKFMNTFQKNTE